MKLAGQLDLGSVGSILGGTGDGDGYGKLTLNGFVTGGSLTTNSSRLYLQMHSLQMSYTGETRTSVKGQSSFRTTVRLMSTSAIILREDKADREGTIQLTNSGQADRIANNIPVRFFGGAWA